MKSASIKPRLPEKVVGDMIGEQALGERPADFKRKELSRQEANQNLSKGAKNIMRV